MGPEQLWIGKLPDKPNKTKFIFYKLTGKMPKTPSCNICISLLLWHYNSILVSDSNSPNILPTACLWKSFFFLRWQREKEKNTFFILLQSSYAQSLCEKLIRKVKQGYEPKNIHALFLVFTVKKLKIPGRLILLLFEWKWEDGKFYFLHNIDQTCIA